MAERYPEADIIGRLAYLADQVRITSVLSSNDIVYGDEQLLSEFCQVIVRKRSGPNAGVILERFEQYINVRLRDGNLYAEESHYDVYNTLGKGAFGTVYLCRDKSSNLPFAIKLIKLMDDSKHYKALDREVRTLLCLDYLHVIKLYGIIQREESIIHVLLEPWGVSLKTYLTTGSPTPNDVYLWFSQLLSAVIYIHGKDLVHCDIHFGNILIQDQVIKLCDFGSAKTIGEDLFTNSHGNTPIYFPPTVLKYLRSRKPINVSPRLDTYAVGKLLLEVINGRSNSPIDDISDDVISDKTKWNNFVKSKMPKNTPVEIQEVIMGLMSFTTNDGIIATHAEEILRTQLHYSPALSQIFFQESIQGPIIAMAERSPISDYGNRLVYLGEQPLQQPLPIFDELVYGDESTQDKARCVAQFYN